MTTTFDVIIVGGGAAGLTAAAYASRAGLSVGLFEQQACLGGLVQSVDRDGFRFDTGLRAIENAGIVLPMLTELGISLDYVPSKVSLGIEDTIIHLKSQESLAAYRDLLLHFYPKQEASIDAIMGVIQRIMRDMDVLYGIDNPLFKDPLRDRPYLFGTLLPWMFRFLVTIGRINRMNGPVEELLAELTHDPALRSIVGQHFFKGTPAFFAMSYFSVYLDYIYPKGGTGALTESLADYIRKLQVAVHTQTAIIHVDPDARTVVDDRGTNWTYGSLIWCADQKALYRCIKIDTMKDAGDRQSVGARCRELEGHSGSDSALSLYLAVNVEPNYFEAIANGHLFYSPDAQGLQELHTTGLHKLLHAYDDIPLSREVAQKFLREFFALTTYEISIPALKDPALAPPKKTGLIVSCLFSYQLTRRIHDAGWYKEFKALCAHRIIEVLSDSLYPGLDQQVISWLTTTPLSIERQTGNSDGAITGWAFTSAKMPVVTKMQQVARSVITPIPGILQAGQWTYSPAGLPMALLTGKLAANRAKKVLHKR